jgi:transposase InsO family protein
VRRSAPSAALDKLPDRSAHGLSRATVSRILRRLKLNRIRDLEPAPVVERYEHPLPADLLHLDIKKLVRIARPSHRVTGDRRDTVRGIGSEYVHVAIDDHSRIAFSGIYPDKKRSSVIACLRSTLDWYARLGIHFKAVLTDNGPAYRSLQFAQACRELGLNPPIDNERDSVIGDDTNRQHLCGLFRLLT